MPGILCNMIMKILNNCIVSRLTQLNTNYRIYFPANGVPGYKNKKKKNF